jgi:hypothetical protein
MSCANKRGMTEQNSSFNILGRVVIRIQRLCGSGSGSVLGIRIPDPDPGARKLRNISVKMQFLVIFKKIFTTIEV